VALKIWDDRSVGDTYLDLTKDESGEIGLVVRHRDGDIINWLLLVSLDGVRLCGGLTPGNCDIANEGGVVKILDVTH
jgi:hypothetical protein